MTLRVRRNTITVLILLQAFLLAIAISGLSIIDPGYAELAGRFPGLTHRLVWLALLIPVQAALVRLFRKSSIPEMFLAIFCISLIGMEGFSIIFVFLQELQQPIIYYELVARLYVLVQIAGISGFFFIALYVGGIQYVKIANIIWAQVVVGFLFAYALPIQTAGSFTVFSVPAGTSYLPLLYGGGILSIFAGISGLIQQRSLEGWKLQTGCYLMIIGRLISLQGTAGMHTTGMLVLLIGLTIFAVEQYQRYLWN